MVLLSELFMAFSSLIGETIRVLEGITLTGESVADAEEPLCETVWGVEEVTVNKESEPDAGELFCGCTKRHFEPYEHDPEVYDLQIVYKYQKIFI